MLEKWMQNSLIIDSIESIDSMQSVRAWVNGDTSCTFSLPNLSNPQLSLDGSSLPTVDGITASSFTCGNPEIILWESSNDAIQRYLPDLKKRLLLFDDVRKQTAAICELPLNLWYSVIYHLYCEFVGEKEAKEVKESMTLRSHLSELDGSPRHFYLPLQHCNQGILKFLSSIFYNLSFIANHNHHMALTPSIVATMCNSVNRMNMKPSLSKVGETKSIETQLHFSSSSVVWYAANKCATYEFLVDGKLSFVRYFGMLLAPILHEAQMLRLASMLFFSDPIKLFAAETLIRSIYLWNALPPCWNNWYGETKYVKESMETLSKKFIVMQTRIDSGDSDDGTNSNNFAGKGLMFWLNVAGEFEFISPGALGTLNSTGTSDEYRKCVSPFDFALPKGIKCLMDDLGQDDFMELIRWIGLSLRDQVTAQESVQKICNITNTTVAIDEFPTAADDFTDLTRPKGVYGNTVFVRALNFREDLLTHLHTLSAHLSNQVAAIAFPLPRCLVQLTHEYIPPQI